MLTIVEVIFTADNTWSTKAVFLAHQTGCTSVSWAPYAHNVIARIFVMCITHIHCCIETSVFRLVSGGCDNAVIVWQTADIIANQWQSRTIGCECD